VRIRGCVDDECKDIYIDVTYEVVRLLLEGYSNTDNSDYQLSPLELRQILGHDSESSLVVPLRMSDGRDFTWTAEFRSPLDSVDWLTFTASGNQDEPLVLSLLEELDSLGYRSTSISISTEIDSIDAFFRYEAVPPLEISATELHFSAPAGTAPEPQTIKVWDADGQQYDWEIRIGHFSGAGCPGSAQPEIEFLEGGPDVLPAVFQVTPPVFPEPGQCRATLEIIPDKFIDMVFHHVRMSYEITE
jgi:hypothetical protein